MGASTRAPLVTIVVAVHNGERYLDEALASALAQDHPRVEVVVVDDGSTDSTGEIARQDQRVRYYHQSNQGMALARNHGIRVAEGELVTFLDADDVLLRDRLRAQVDYLEAHPEIGCVLARHDLLLAPGQLRPAWLVPDGIFGDAGGVEPGSAMLATGTARQIGFDPRYPMVDGMEWLSRLTDAGVRVGVCDQVLWHRRIHGGNHSRDRPALRQEMLRMIRHRITAGRSTTTAAKTVPAQAARPEEARPESTDE